ncbi:MAG TPA: HD domain-containing phosphohydrolase [Burkholderiales bacterium]|nr:HD domain-containing phosphohydrolase [Burkholderiales bacterium]
MSEELKRPVVLAVDDSSDMLALIEKALAMDFEVLTAADAGSGIEKAFGEPRPDLILLDVDMPDVNGFEVCRALKDEALTASIPVIFLTASSETEVQVEALQLGAVDFINKTGTNASVLKARVGVHLEQVNRRAELERLVQARTAELEKTRSELIKRLARVMEMHESQAVGNRVLRLGHYAKLIAQAAGARPELADMMQNAAPLHDIGKLGVPAEILRKAEKLSVPDWERVKRHPELGAEIIGEHQDPLLKLARQLALTHHENYDGTGYPKGLKGDAIPWGGRVMAIVDTFEAMTTTQFYRDALPVVRAAGEIERAAGIRFDPKLVEAFKKALPVMQKVLEKYSDSLGDMINLDFAPKGAQKPAPTAGAQNAAPAAPPPTPVAQASTRPRMSAAEIARAAAKKHR